MSTTSQVTDFNDLFTDLQNRVRVTTGVTATENQSKRYINTALQDMHLGTDYKLPWAERRAVLRTHDDYTTGTIDVSIGSTTVTGTSTLWTTANSYGENNARTTGKMLIGGGSDPYRITTVGSATSITLTDRYVATATADDATYIYFEDEYALASDFLRPIDMQSFSDDLDIPLIDRKEFRRRYPRPNVSGRPRVACLLDLGFSGSSTPVRRVQFWPYPDSTYLIPYTYVTANLAVSSAGVEATALSANTDEPIVPLRYRHLLVMRALADWYRDKKDDSRANDALGAYTDGMLRLLGDVETGTNRSWLRPRIGSYWSAAKAPYRRGGTSRYDINDRFDRME